MKGQRMAWGLRLQEGYSSCAEHLGGLSAERRCGTAIFVVLRPSPGNRSAARRGRPVTPNRG